MMPEFFTSRPFIFSRFAWVLTVILGSCYLSGCQSVGGRWREIGLGADNHTDDWEPPRTTRFAKASTSPGRSGQPTKPGVNAFLPPNQASPTTINSQRQSSTPEATVAPIQPAKNVQAAKEAPTAKAPPLETQASDVDIDGAIAALPPNLQKIAKQQLAAVDARQQNSKPVSVKLSDQEDRPTTQVASIAANPVIPASHVVTASIRSDDSETKPNDEKHLDNPVKPAVAFEATNQESDVKAASLIQAETPLKPRTWNQSVADAVEKLQQQMSDETNVDRNTRLNQEVTLRLLQLASRRLDDAMKPIDDLLPNEQDYFRHQMQALYEASNPDASPVNSRRWSLVMNSQRQATHKLAAASNLDVRTLAFCTDVQGYGVIKKFPKSSFKPDQELLLYCELDNVLAEQVKGGYETQLQGTYELLDADGRRIADQLLPMERELCQNHRRDYFIIYHIYMPTKIEPGKYQMRVTIEDMKAKKFGQSTIDFEIAE
jgi:hypothetical protein